MPPGSEPSRREWRRPRGVYDADPRTRGVRVRTGAWLVAAWMLLTGASQVDLSRSAALELLKKDAAAAAPVKQSLVLSTRCTIGGRTTVPDDLAALEQRGLIKVTQSPLDPAVIALMGSDGVNALLGVIPDACIFTIRNTYGGMAGLVASGQREFNVMDVSITAAGRAMGLGPGYSEIAILRDEPDAITGITNADQNTRRVEYTVRSAFTDAGRKTGLAELFVKQPRPSARVRFFRRIRDNWGLVP